MYERRRCRAFARADRFGKLKPANGPVSRVVTGGFGGTSDSTDEARDRVSSGWTLAAMEISWGTVAGCSVGVLLYTGLIEGKSRSRILTMGAMCEPASTASNEPLDQPLATARTKNPVTFSSHGPPELPRQMTCNAGALP